MQIPGFCMEKQVKTIGTGECCDRCKLHSIPTLAVMIFIFIHSAMPGEMSGAESRYFAEILASATGMSFKAASFIVRKAAHFTEFTALGICLSFSVCDCFRKLSGHSKSVIKSIPPDILAWIIGTLYAGTDEFHQLFVDGRGCEFRDVCIDAAGTALGIMIAGLIRHVGRSKMDGSVDRS